MKKVDSLKHHPSLMKLREEELERLIHSSRTIHLDRNDFLLHEGQICRHTILVQHGLLREYSIDNKGREHILQFATEGCLLVNVESVYFSMPSNYFVQAIEPSIIGLIDEDLFPTLAQDCPGFLDLKMTILHTHILNLRKRITQLQSIGAEARYVDFVRTYPNVHMRIPQAMVASFIGVTPESLSRIRRDRSYSKA